MNVMNLAMLSMVELFIIKNELSFEISLKFFGRSGNKIAMSETMVIFHDLTDPLIYEYFSQRIH